MWPTNHSLTTFYSSLFHVFQTKVSIQWISSYHMLFTWCWSGLTPFFLLWELKFNKSFNWKWKFGFLFMTSYNLLPIFNMNFIKSRIYFRLIWIEFYFNQGEMTKIVQKEGFILWIFHLWNWHLRWHCCWWFTFLQRIFDRAI